MNTRYFLALFFVFCSILAKGVDTFTINLNNTSPVQYCSAPVHVAQSISINASFQITGMKVSFSQGFIPGEDNLTYTPPSGSSIVGTWYSDQGYLLLQGNSTATPLDYENAIGQVLYKNNNPIPTLGDRKISISLINADYLPYTGHFYRFISRRGISWTEAKAEASSDSMMYYGLRGYLATVTSQEENDFIKLKTKGVGWIGATDIAQNYYWRWVTGPEGLQNNGQGLLFWIGLGSQYASGVAGTGPVAGAYTNWNSGEPNDTGGTEFYAHITFFPGNLANSYKWNDLPNGGSTGDYVPAGYLVEYGGMPGDPVVQLSATADLQVNTISFNTKSISPVCEGVGVALNQPDNAAYPATYLWSPAATLSDAKAANPVATPKVTTTYTVTETRGICTENQDYIVQVHPLPVISFSIDSTTCVGYNLDVSYTGNNVNPAISNFTWIFGGDTIINAVDSTKVNIPLGINRSKRDLKLIVEQYGCTNSDSIRNIHVIPRLSQWAVNDSLLCLPDSFIFSVINPDPTVVRYDWDFGDGTQGIGVNPTHNYQHPARYDIRLTVTNNEKCSNTAIIPNMVHAAPVPVAAFSLSDSIIYTNKPTVSFLDVSSLATQWDWDFGDGTLGSGKNPPEHNYKGTGRRTVLLKVTSDFNCTDTVSHHLLIAFDRIFPPNGFSPNAPNAIDRVFLLNSEGVKSAGYHFVVLSRWDDIVFEAKDEIKGWDGRMKNGSFAPAGVYLWILDYTDFLGQKHRQTGTVTVIY